MSRARWFAASGRARCAAVAVCRSGRRFRCVLFADHAAKGTAPCDLDLFDLPGIVAWETHGDDDMTQDEWIKQQRPDILAAWQRDGSPTCPTHQIPMRWGLLPVCPDGKAGCMVAHAGWRCPKCRATPAPVAASAD